LLTHFKSVARIKKAPLNELTEVGIPQNVAEDILKKLNEN